MQGLDPEYIRVLAEQRESRLRRNEANLRIRQQIKRIKKDIDREEKECVIYEAYSTTYKDNPKQRQAYENNILKVKDRIAALKNRRKELQEQQLSI